MVFGLGQRERRKGPCEILEQMITPMSYRKLTIILNRRLHSKSCLPNRKRKSGFKHEWDKRNNIIICMGEKIHSYLERFKPYIWCNGLSISIVWLQLIGMLELASKNLDIHMHTHISTGIIRNREKKGENLWLRNHFRTETRRALFKHWFGESSTYTSLNEL